MSDLTGDGVRVLIIATANHTGSMLPSLPSVEQSFHDLRDALGSRCGVSPHNIATVFDPADARVMAQAITEEAGRARSVLLIYYIGHGLRGPGGDLYLAAVDTDELTPGLAAHQALPFAAIAQALHKCVAASVVIVLDCCFSGTAALEADTTSIREFATGAHGRYLIGSAEYLALAPQNALHTAFTGALLALLENGDPRAPAMLSLDAVFDGVYRSLRDSQGTPLPRRQAGDRAGDLILAPNRAATAPPLPAPNPTPGRCPYPGLTPFDIEDAAMFFGRDSMVEQLLATLAAATESGGPIILVGPSGSGKTSLLNAGVSAAMRDRGLPGVEDSVGWPVRRLTPGAEPLKRLLAALDAPDKHDLIDREPDLITTVADQYLSVRPSQKLLVIVDQLEQLFTLCPDHAARTSFLHALHVLTAPHGRDQKPRALVLLALRADFYGHATAHSELVGALRDRQVLIEPMSLNHLREAIEKPTHTGEWAIADGLAEVILNDLGSDTATAAGVLPLLSHAMWSTWTRREGRTLTVAGYRDTGGIAHAIKQSAEDIYTSSDPSGRDALRQMLPRLVRVSTDGDADTAQPADRASLTAAVADPAVAQHALDQLTQARLIIMDRDTIRLSHETLLREWPRLREWIDLDRDWLHRSQRFIADSRNWQRSGRDSELLYRRTQLAAVRERYTPTDTDPIHTDPLAAAFFTAAIRAEKRQTRKRQATQAFLLALVVALAAATVVAWRATGESNRQRDIAIARELISSSTQMAATDPFGSRLTALAAWRIHPSPEAHLTMLNAARNPDVGVLAHEGKVNAIAFSPDGRIMATGNTDRTVRLWDTTTHQQIGAPLSGHTRHVNTVAFAPDGRTLASGGDDYTVRLWDIDSGQPIGEPYTGHNRPVSTVRFAPDGNAIASLDDQTMLSWDITTRRPTTDTLTTSVKIGTTAEALSLDTAVLATASDREVRLWERATGQPIGEPFDSEHTRAVVSLTFSPDGRTLATGSSDGTVRLWDTGTRALRGTPLLGHTSIVTSIAFSPDGATMATASTDNTARVWDTDTHQQVGGPLSHHTGPLTSVAFSPDGTTLISGSADHTARVWNIAARRPSAKPASGAIGTIAALSFGSDGRTLTSAGSGAANQVWDAQNGRALSGPLFEVPDEYFRGALTADGRILATTTQYQTVRLWDTRTASQIAESFATGHVYDIRAIAFSPDSHTLATAGSDKSVRLWNIDTRQQIGPTLTGHTAAVGALAFSPDGRTLATGSDDLTIRVWDVQTREQLRGPLTGHTGMISALQFSPDSKTLASGSGDNSIRLWDAITGNSIGNRLIGHISTVYELAFNPDGHLLASISADDTLRLWDVQAFSQIGEPVHEPSETLISLAFSPDGATLATGGKGTTLRFWDVRFSLDIAGFLCDWARGTFTSAMWERYVPNGPAGRPLCP